MHVKIPQKRPLRLRMGNERLRRKQLFLNISKFPVENFSGTKKGKKEKESRYKKLYRGTDRELTPLR